MGIGVWKGSSFCSGTEPVACESGAAGGLLSVAWGGEWDVHQHGALLLDSAPEAERCRLCFILWG